MDNSIPFSFYFPEFLLIELIPTHSTNDILIIKFAKDTGFTSL